MTFLLCTAVLLSLIAVLSLRWVPAGECLVILRGPHVRRVVGPGLTILDPIRDHSARFDLDVQEVPLVVHTVNRDSDDLVALGRLRFRVDDPATAAHTAVDPITLTVQVAEEVASSELALLRTSDLREIPPSAVASLLRAINLSCGRWGVTVESVSIEQVDVHLVVP